MIINFFFEISISTYVNKRPELTRFILQTPLVTRHCKLSDYGSPATFKSECGQFDETIDDSVVQVYKLYSRIIY